jgi:hypothetical protein
MIQQSSEPATLGPLLQSFLTEHLISHRLASRQTVDGYRDAFRLLQEFLRRTKGKAPSAPCVSDLDAPSILEFLDYLEKERHNSTRSRNVRLSAIRSFFRLVALRDPASVNLATRVLAMPVKRTDRRRTPSSARDPLVALRWRQGVDYLGRRAGPGDPRGRGRLPHHSCSIFRNWKKHAGITQKCVRHVWAKLPSGAPGFSTTKNAV